jgi:phosphonate transport system permease protein
MNRVAALGSTSAHAYSATTKVSFGFVAVALLCLAFADISVTTLDPWGEMSRLAWGILTPDFFALENITSAVIQTIAFALVGVALGAGGGFLLALVFHIGPVRWVCAFVRAIHELFWALIFLQMLGLTPWTGVLAIALPYAAICAKIYAETLEEAQPEALKALPAGVSSISAFFFVRLPDAWVHIKNYTSYRFECGLRSSTVLGFVGLPTLGFYLETAFGEGIYSEAAALLFIFYILIATLKVWMKPKLIGLYLLAAPFALATADTTPVNFDNIVRFFSQDIVPHPLRGQGWMDAGVLSNFGDWVSMLWVDQAVPGIIATVLLTQIALVASGMLTLVFFPLVSKKFFGTFGRTLGHGFLVVVRSTPEFILAYVFLQLWGPSMLPAIVALALHNGAIMGHLVGRYSDNVQLRPDSPKGLNLYGYEIVPRVYGQFLAFLFYRWEVIMRETTILGILGIATLGFFIDSGLQDIRLDRALFFIIITAFLNIGVDILSRNIRARLRLSAKVEQT